jgi:hypothetical protein
LTVPVANKKLVTVVDLVDDSVLYRHMHGKDVADVLAVQLPTAGRVEPVQPFGVPLDSAAVVAQLHA